MSTTSGVPTLGRGARRALLWLALPLVLFPLTVSKPGLPVSFKSDEPAYYLAALSLARDGDLELAPGEAGRLFEEFPYLTVKNLILMTDDGWRTVYYGKPYVYSLFAAPFAGLAGANGMVAFNMLLLMAMIWMGASYLRQFNPDGPAVAYSVGYFLLGSTFAYVFWMHPEIFSMAGVTGALYFAFRPEQPAAALLGRRWRRLRGAAARPILSAACLAPAVYNKPMLALLALAPLWIFLRRQGWRGVVRFCAGALLAGGLVAGISLVLTGNASAYLGVMRRGFNVPHAEFMPAVLPLEDEAQAGQSGSWWWILAAPTAEAGELIHSLRYFLVGRHTGLFVYTPFALLSLLLFALHRLRSRRRWLLLASLAGVALFFLLWIPFNWHGGGGFIGNRYYINAYPGFLFLVARVAPVWLTGLGYAAGGLLAGSLLFTPFGPQVHRPTLQAHVRHKPFRLFPYELPLREKIPGYAGAAQLDKWFWGRADQFESHGEEMWFHGNVEVPVWLFSSEPLGGAVFRVRNLAPGNTVRLRLPGDEALLKFGDEPGTRTAELTPARPSRVLREQGEPLYVYRLEVATARGFSTRRFHLGAAISYLGEPAELARDIWQVEWLECAFPPSVAAGEKRFSGTVRLRNASGEPWPSGPGGRLKLAYHWLDESGETVVFDGARSAFEGVVEPGREVVVQQQVLTPAEPGRHRLQLDLVFEFVGWFSERGAPTCEVEIEVLPNESAAGPGASAP